MSAKAAPIKCVVWDLDGTCWRGTLVEGDAICVHPPVKELVLELDRRGILQSVASRNDHEQARRALVQAGLWEYFLKPQIHWGDKHHSMATLAHELNLGLDAFLLVDDSPFERDLVRAVHPSVRCIDPSELPGLLSWPELEGTVITDDARWRRKRYQDEERRQADEAEFQGPRTEFLRTLGMRLRIARATEADLARAEELTVRTNQLNTSGTAFSQAQLREVMLSSNHSLWMASLEDRYGDYGRIGLALIEEGSQGWTIKLFLLSCRVMSRNIGSAFLGWLLRRARDARVTLEADFFENDRNRVMAVTYRFAGFRRASVSGRHIKYVHYMSELAPLPAYVTLDAP